MSITSLASMRAFRKVVEAGGFSRAAQALGTTAGSVSKLVAQLERELGVRLLARSTRRMNLTEPGRLFLERCVRALEELEAAEDTLEALREAPRGLLRVSVPTSFGLRCLSSRVPLFLQRHPQVQLDLQLNDRFVNLLEEGFDCALRIADGLPDSTLVARELAPIARVLVASSAYLREHGTPRTIESLDRHECLVYTLSSTPNVWTFQASDGVLQVHVQGRYCVNNSVMLREALLAGAGIAATPRFVVEDLIDDGRLQVLLPRTPPRGHRLYGLLPHSRYPTPKTRAFLDFVAEAVASTAVRGT